MPLKRITNTNIVAMQVTDILSGLHLYTDTKADNEINGVSKVQVLLHNGINNPVYLFFDLGVDTVYFIREDNAVDFTRFSYHGQVSLPISLTSFRSAYKYDKLVYEAGGWTMLQSNPLTDSVLQLISNTSVKKTAY